MDVRVLGPLELLDGGEPRALAGAKERAILVRLAIDAGRTVSQDALIDAVWGERAPESAVRSLHVRIAKLRAVLEPDRARGAAAETLVRDPAGYRLALAPECVDALRFQALVAEAASAAPRDALVLLDEALALWRGRPLADADDADWAVAEARRLEDLRRDALERRALALSELGRHEEALPALREVVEDDPLREDAVRRLVLALYRTGRQVEALDVHRSLVSGLRELGLEPSAETRELEHAILVHDPDLVTPAVGAAAAGRAPAERATGGNGAASTPAPAPGAGTPIPARAARFFGRAAELERCGRALGEGRLVTVTGAGGAGKTTLSVELAARLAADEPASPLWCELARAQADADVAGAFLQATGLSGASGGAVLDRVVEQLRDRRVLLLVDNCEQVVDAAADAIERLLGGCPALRVVATSRVPLGVAGERIVRLGGLELDRRDTVVPAAVGLFLDRAAAAGAEGVEDDLDDVREICRRLDGLPLALELAASRLRSMSAAEVRARLDERFRLLAPAGRRGQARHRTLEAAIDWSYELLDADARRVFERLSVFAGPCTLEGAQDVCADEEIDRADVLDVLDGLVAASMVVTVAARDAGGTRYAMLESLREYARRQLAERGEQARVRDAHADHYERHVDRLRTDDAAWREPVVPFVSEFPDLRAAVRWCIKADEDPERAFTLVHPLWATAYIHAAEGSALLAEAALERWPGVASVGALNTLGTAATARLVVADAARALAHAQAAIDLEPAVGQPALLGRRTLVFLAAYTGNRDAGLVRDYIERARGAHDAPLACEALGLEAQLAAARGDHVAAGELARAMRAEAERLRAPALRAWSSFASGVVVLEHDPAGARPWLERSITLARAASYGGMARLGLRALGIAAALEGDPGLGADHLLAALAEDEAVGEAAQQWATLKAVGIVLGLVDQAPPAARLLAVAAPWPAAPWLLALAGRWQEIVGAPDEGHADSIADLAAARAFARGHLAELREPGVRDEATASAS